MSYTDDQLELMTPPEIHLAVNELRRKAAKANGQLGELEAEDVETMVKLLRVSRRKTAGPSAPKPKAKSKTAPLSLEDF